MQETDAFPAMILNIGWGMCQGKIPNAVGAQQEARWMARYCSAVGSRMHVHTDVR